MKEGLEPLRFQLFGVLTILLTATMPAQPPVNLDVVTLSDSMAAWRAEIEQSDGGELVPVRFFHDPDGNRAHLQMPDRPDQSSVLTRYLQTPGFREALEATYALNLNYSGLEGVFHFVILNMTRADEWRHYEEAVLAHEFGHVWLNARGYAAPEFDGAENSCVAMVSGDAVQHIMIRQELRRRRIPYLAYWISKLDSTREALEAGVGGDLPDCRLLTLMGEWLDVRLGLSPAVWQGYDQYVHQMQRSFPMLAEEVEALAAMLEGRDVEDPETYQALLRQVSARFSDVLDRFRDRTASGRDLPR